MAMIVNHSMSDFMDTHNSIKRGLDMVGQGLMRMRDERLYLAGDFKTFDAYLKELSMSTRTAYREIERYTTISGLANIGTNLTLSKSQIDALSAVPSSQRELVIAMAQSASEATAKPLTAARIERVAEVVHEIIVTGAIDVGDGESHPLDSNPLYSAVLKNELETIQRQAQHQRSRNTRQYHGQNVEARVFGRTIQFSEQLNIPDGAIVMVSFWSEDNEETS